MAVGAVVVAFMLTLGGCGGHRRAGERPGRADAAALTAGREFLDSYVDPDGRVVRRDQGGDTVSEGQAYGMLVAIAVDDRDRFLRIWRWTRQHLSRPDALLSWHWVDGRVVDANSAADADLDAARALVMAGERYADPGLRADGLALARAVVDHETVRTAVGRVLTAGSWATRAPYPVNPSYQSPRTVDLLRRATADARYDELRAGSQAVVRAVVAGGRLPPDWVRVDADGTVTAIPAPDGTGPAFGLDAARLPVRLAESCDPTDRGMATRLRSALVNRPDPAVGVSALDGQPLVDWRHPLALIAGAAAAIDDRAAVGTLLDRADDLHRKHPTYYAAAWAALGRLMLTTSRLGGCDQTAG